MQDQYVPLKLQYLCSLKEAMALKSDKILAHQNQSICMGSPEPPLMGFYENLVRNSNGVMAPEEEMLPEDFVLVDEYCELPIIDVSRLNGGEFDVEECKREIVKASEEWGFFQVVNHGIPGEILDRMRSEQVRVFEKPFEVKEKEEGLPFKSGSYRWGTKTAKYPSQLSWIEAFHVPMTSFQNLDDHTNLSSTMVQFATTVSELARKFVEILAENMGQNTTFFEKNCLPSTCYIRMNRYPPCPVAPEMFGLVKHTDSDFLTILHQDQIGGLQLYKDGKWMAVKPNQETLVINIGDLFQAWSNGVYKSVEHRVVTNNQVQRFSTAYFVCPFDETKIQSCIEPSIYRTFSFGEFRKQVSKDVQNLGKKIGLPRFLVSTES
ncbi:gibberellin 2-beta-dioxygenase 8-like [Cornus florida]|uniref:gibberellin 2-beta-dioxygenase 8-like n=1 Tax=Cornus florida TaxID=4283 RepID=UPI00289FD101|nr:gibberellin 2-beta-dioxygenase 8-like [Cornus florida]